jgi:hypothetical protein
MKNSQTASDSGNAIVARPTSMGWFAALLAGLISVSLPVAVCRAQPAGDNEPGVEVLTRGPVHEAFAGVVSYNPEPGIVVTTPPPDPIEEIPPEEKPEGDDVAWIPGYWGWDDERNDYLWISGTWRALPPGREWMAGYWRDTGQGYQWISGYWADATEQETTYLPPPPMTLEVGANLDAPSDDYSWTPGCWVWQQDRYAWRAGYWAQGRSDWVWVPANYVWTPRGVIFVEGFWDYPVEQRGLLFAPVHYESREYARRGYTYSPRIVINLSAFTDNLFVRPSYHHYYFGDYYDSRYDQGGFYASYSFQSSRHGYDPFYSHDRWEHRSDREWENHFQAAYQDRRQHEAARPPRTWAAQLTINTRPVAGGQIRISMAAPIEQLATRKDNPVRFQPLAQGDRQQLAQRGREVQQSRDQRRTVEAKAVVPTGRKAGEVVAPAKVSVLQSPIAAKPAGQRGGNQAPPQAPQGPRPDPRVQPKAEAPGHQSNLDQRNSPSVTRPPERNAVIPRETPTQPSPEQRPSAVAVKAQEESQRKANESQMKTQQDADQRARDANSNAQAATKAQQDEERLTRDANVKSQAAEKTQQQAEDRGKAAAAKAQEDSTRKAQQDDERRAKDAEVKAQGAARAQQQDEERAKDSKVKAQEDAQRKEQPAQARSQPDTEKRDRGATANSPTAERLQPPAEDRGKAAAANAQDDAQRKAQQAQVKAQQDAAKRANDAAKAKPAPKEKPADAEDDDPKKDKGKAQER